MDAEAEVLRVRRQPGELDLIQMDQRRVVATLKIHIGRLADAVVDDDSIPWSC